MFHLSNGPCTSILPWRRNICLSHPFEWPWVSKEMKHRLYNDLYLAIPNPLRNICLFERSPIPILVTFLEFIITRTCRTLKYKISRLRQSRSSNPKPRRFSAIARGVLLRDFAIVIEAIELAALWGPTCVIRTIGISKLIVFVDDRKSRPEFASRAYECCYEIRGVRHWLWRD